VAGENSRFTLIEEHVSVTEGLDAFTNCAVEVQVGAGAKLELVSLQRLSRQTWHFADQRARLARGAQLDWVCVGLGSRKGKTRIFNDLAEAGATSRVTGIYFADGSQHLDFDTYQEHAAPHTSSDFLFRGALRDEATTVWRGMIRVEPEARAPTPTRRTAISCSRARRTPTRSPGSRSWPTTFVAATAPRSDRSTATSSST